MDGQVLWAATPARPSITDLKTSDGPSMLRTRYLAVGGQRSARDLC